MESSLLPCRELLACGRYRMLRTNFHNNNPNARKSLEPTFTQLFQDQPNEVAAGRAS